MSENNQITIEDAVTVKQGSEVSGFLSRRVFIRNAAFAGAALTALESGAGAQQSVVGSYSNSAVADLRNQVSLTGERSSEARALEIKIKRAMLSGPSVVTRDATVIDNDKNGKPVVLRKGTNSWVCSPGNENEVGNPPMCADPMAMLWFADVAAGKARPTNTHPGFAYMLCGATQHSNTDALDTTSPAIPIGPHLWFSGRSTLRSVACPLRCEMRVRG